jgi:RNA polymerase sigma factor (sigma-70 family)
MIKNLAKDKALIDSILENRDSEYIQIMYERIFVKIKKIVFDGGGNPDDAKDLLHDTVLLFFKAVREGNYKQNTDVDAYVYTIAKNRWLNKVVRDKKIVHTDKQMEISTNEVTTMEQIYSKERVNIVQKALELVGEKCKELLKLIYFDNNSTAEIIEIMGYTSADVVKTKHYKCKQSMMVQLQGNANYKELF